MPQISRHYCSRCGNSVYNCMIDGQRVPIALYFVVGQPPDTGDQVDVNALPVPSFVRELLAVPVSRAELCMKCVSEVFGVPCVLAKDDPMYDVNNDKIPDALQLMDPDMSQVERSKRMHMRALHAIKVGRGVASPADLPSEYLPPPTQDAPRRPFPPVMTTESIKVYLASLSESDRAKALEELSSMGITTPA